MKRGTHSSLHRLGLLGVAILAPNLAGGNGETPTVSAVYLAPRMSLPPCGGGSGWGLVDLSRPLAVDVSLPLRLGLPSVCGSGLPSPLRLGSPSPSRLRSPSPCG